MATRTKKVNNWYMKYAEKEMGIDMDEQGLFCSVPSECEENKLYVVRVDESMMVPTAESCGCKAFEVHHECKHCQIVSSFYKRIYKSNVAKAAEVVEVAPKVVEIAESLDIPVAEVEAIAVIAQEHRKEMSEGKHTEMTLPIGPGDVTRKRKPRKYATELMEKQRHYASVKSQMAEIRERREAELANLNGTREFAIMR